MGIRRRSRASTEDEGGADGLIATGGETGPTETDESPIKRRPFHRLWLARRPIGIALLVLGVFSAGMVAGWKLRDGQDDTVVANSVEVDRPITALAGTDATVATPNVLGLTRDDAITVLTDAGVAIGAIEVVQTPAAGEPGLVVRQVPPPGVPTDGTVTLSVSIPGTMPDLKNKPIAEARRTIEAMGARVIVKAVYVDGVNEGTVTATAPAAGAPLPVEVVLTVAGPPSSVFLSDLSPTDGSCSTGDAAVGGKDFEASLSCRVPSDPADSNEIAYLVDKVANRFEATLGQEDTGDPGSVIRIIVRADAKTVVDETLGYGQAKAVSVPVDGALRLTITVLLVSGPEDANAPQAVLGSARIIGGPAAIESLLSTE